MTKMLVAATLASSMSDDLLARATITVVQILKNKEVKPEMTRTNIQMIGAFWWELFPNASGASIGHLHGYKSTLSFKNSDK